MKKYCFLFSFALLLLPTILFAEGVGVFSIGTTLEGSKLIDHTTPMPAVGFDVHGIASSGGFTFFWNNTYSFARTDLTFVSSEILLGRTCRKRKALNISFGFGARLAVGLNPQRIVGNRLDYLLPGLGGTLGFSYYFNDVLGLSLFASDFVCLRTSAHTRHADKQEAMGKLSFTEGISNTVSIRLGMNVRIGGKLVSNKSSKKKRYFKNKQTAESTPITQDEQSTQEEQNTQDEKSVEETPSNNLSEDATRLPTPQEVLDELNLVRSNPKNYVKFLKERLNTFEGMIYTDGIGRKMRTHEGIDAVYECIEVLQNTEPMQALILNDKLSDAALWLAEDQAHSGTIGHVGSDGSELKDRINRSGFVWMGCGENCSYGKYTARDFILSLLIDDNVPSRGHRNNILKPEFAQVGIGLAKGHIQYNTVLVTDFGY